MEEELQDKLQKADDLQAEFSSKKELADRSLDPESHARRARAVMLAEQRKQEAPVKPEPEPVQEEEEEEPVAPEPEPEREPEPEPEPEKAKPFLRKYIGSGNPSIQDSDPSNDTFGIQALEQAQAETGLTRAEIIRLAKEQGLGFTANFQKQYDKELRSTYEEATGKEYLRQYIGSANPSLSDSIWSNDTFGVEALNKARESTGLSDQQIIELAQRQGLSFTEKLRQQYGTQLRGASANQGYMQSAQQAPAPSRPAPTPQRPVPSSTNLRNYVNPGNPTSQDSDPRNDTFGVDALNNARSQTGMGIGQIIELARGQGLNFTEKFKREYANELAAYTRQTRV